MQLTWKESWAPGSERKGPFLVEKLKVWHPSMKDRYEIEIIQEEEQMWHSWQKCQRKSCKREVGEICSNKMILLIALIALTAACISGVGTSGNVQTIKYIHKQQPQNTVTIHSVLLMNFVIVKTCSQFHRRGQIWSLGSLTGWGDHRPNSPALLQLHLALLIHLLLLLPQVVLRQKGG